MSNKLDKKFDKFQILYIVIAMVTLFVMTVGSTYAYWTASTQSNSSSLQTKSTIYSISMTVEPLYVGYTVIPMDDEDVIKALDNSCLDKYDRGACLAYKVRVYDYSSDLKFISGLINVTTNNVENLSYTLFRLSDSYEEESCVTIDNDYYCQVLDVTAVESGADQSIGDSYDVTGMTETTFIFVIWITNLDFSQNDTDIGSFNATLTVQSGNGGEIKGSIYNALVIENVENGE